MTIHIPAHLDNIKIVSQLSSFIKAYSEQFTESSGSFDHYYNQYTQDSIKKFIYLSLEVSNVTESNNYNEVAIYLSRLFYSVKGSLRIFDYMKDYLKIPFVGEILYTINEIRFEVSEITTVDMENYISSMKDFISSLLYYNDLSITIDTIKLIVSGNIENIISSGIISYKEFKATKS